MEVEPSWVTEMIKRSNAYEAMLGHFRRLASGKGWDNYKHEMLAIAALVEKLEGDKNEVLIAKLNGPPR